MLWRMPADTRGQRIGTMATAQTFSAHPQPATNVSATNVFHRPKWAALTALTALTPGMGGSSGTATGVAVAEIAGIGRPVDGSNSGCRPAVTNVSATIVFPVADDRTGNG